MPETEPEAIDEVVPGCVATVLQTYPKPVQERLTALRRVILRAARRTEDVGEIIETLKWGQPSYLPSKPRTGSTIRIGVSKSRPGHPAVFFHCQTRLVETFRHLYPDTFTFEGNRALLLAPDGPMPEDEIGHCVSLALTYHLWK